MDYELSYTAEHIDELLEKVDELPDYKHLEGLLYEKVDKEEGKGLSANDYTNTDKALVDAAYQKPKGGIPKTDLNANVLSSLNRADSALQSFTETDPTVPSWAKRPNKPSYNYSEIGNTPDLSGFITKSVDDLTNYYLKSETYTKAEVVALIGAIQKFHYEIYATLPASGESNVLYLIGPTGSGSDKYEEYVYKDARPSGFVKIGDTSIDLSGYVTTSALNTALEGYVSSSDLVTALAAYATEEYVDGELEDALASYTPTSQLSTVATSGDYDDLTNTPGAVSAFANDAGYLTSHQDLSNYIQKSQAAGLIKNDGTVDTNTYLTQHQDISGKADKVLVASSMPVGGFLPNTLYNLGTLSGDTTFTLATPTDNTIANHYYWTFDTPSTAPTITWPQSITAWNGGSAPTINASKHYEVSVLNGIAVAMEV